MIKVEPVIILVVEDSDDTRVLLRRTLAMDGYQVLEAADGWQAVEFAKRDCPDLILMDLNMPVMDGLAATEQIRSLRKQCGDVPIVAVTAFDTYGMKEAALEAGCDAYLLKPLAVDQLEEVITGLLYA